MQIVTQDHASGIIAEITGGISDNAAGILLVLGFILGLSFVMAMLDTAKEGRMLDDYAKRWKQ